MGDPLGDEPVDSDGLTLAGVAEVAELAEVAEAVDFEEHDKLEEGTNEPPEAPAEAPAGADGTNEPVESPLPLVAWVVGVAWVSSSMRDWEEGGGWEGCLPAR